jgi:acyl carrier protein
MRTIDTVRQFVIENFLFGDGSQLKDDTSFYENGIIDSTGILELMSFLEETYDIKIEDEELVPENFDNVNRINNYLTQKLPPQ